jgi:hypothetical protein
MKKSKQGNSCKNTEPTNKSEKKQAAKSSVSIKGVVSPSYEVTYIAVSDITVAGGRRQLSPDTVKSLMESMALIGLRYPLKVCPMNGSEWKRQRTNRNRVPSGFRKYASERA